MSPKTGITMLVLAAIASTAHADIFVNPPTLAMLKTDPNSTPINSLAFPTYAEPEAIWVSYQDPSHPTTSVVVQGAMSFNLKILGYDDSSIAAYRLVLTTVSYTNPYTSFGVPLVSNVTFGTDTTEAFTVSNFFGFSPPPAVGGVLGAATILPNAPQNLVLSFDVTSVVRNARSHSDDYPYLKFWITRPSQGFWKFVPTLQLVGVPEPSTIVLMAAGLSGIGLFGLRLRRRYPAA